LYASAHRWLYHRPRHPESILRPFTETAIAIQQIVPAMPYTPDNGHTTLTVYQRSAAATFVADRAVLEHLCAVVTSLAPALWAAIQITFHEWLLDTDTVLVAGQPNAAFWASSEQIRVAGVQRNLDLRMPWGAHMTAARMLAAGDRATVARIRTLLKAAPSLGISTPVAIEVGSYSCGPHAFTLHPYRRFDRVETG